MIKRTYQYRLHPRPAEHRALDVLLEQSREVYNAALSQCKNAYAASGKHQSAISQWPYFRDWRKTFDDLLPNSCLNCRPDRKAKLFDPPTAKAHLWLCAKTWRISQLKIDRMCNEAITSALFALERDLYNKRSQMFAIR